MARARARRMALAASRASVDATQVAESVAEQAGPQDAQTIEPAQIQPSVRDESSKRARPQPVLMLVVDEEEESEFCAIQPAAPHACDIAPAEVCEAAELDADEPPFDPPELEDLLGGGEEEDEDELVLSIAAGDDEDEPPFDPIDIEELTPPSLSVRVPAEPAPVVEQPARAATLGPVRKAAPEGAREQPAPAIRIYYSWDRPAAGDFFCTVSADARLARTESVIARGGLDGAAIFCAAHQRPDLLVIDTTLRGAAMLASLDRLLEAAGAEAKIIILGALNDVTLLRELAARGVDEYMVWPVKPDELAGAACALFADVDKARVIAVIGARGGIGASTVAHNIAWSIAERQRARTTLVDLDLPFGTAAFDFRLTPQKSLGDVLHAEEPPSDVALERVAARRSDRLTIISAPATPQHDGDLELKAAQALVASARRLSSFVVLDLPHQWEPWIKQALFAADEIVLVSSPDLASLRNTDNIAKLIKNEQKRDPIVVLSMAGVPKRPEVPHKEFAHALGLAPACSFSFEPNLFAAAALTGQMLGEIAPGSSAAMQIDQLATLLTGREPVEVLELEPAIFEDAPALQPDTEEAIADPFADALVNPFALQALDECDIEEPSGAEEHDPPVPTELAPLELLELAPTEPDYIANARAAALEDLDAIENPRRQPRYSLFGRLASAGAGFSISLIAAVVYWHTQSEAMAPSPVAHAAVAQQARAPELPPQERYASALRLLEAGDAAGAMTDLRDLAQAGFVIAQYRLAKLYESGEGVAPDLAQARLWTERAAAGGNRNAMHDLGVYYVRGEGAPRDEATAFRWFQAAAERDLADSQYNLGVLYEQGRGVEANAGEALFWFRLAARQGDAAAAERAADLEITLSPFEIEQAEARLAEFRPTPADPVANGAFMQVSPVERAADAVSGLQPGD